MVDILSDKQIKQLSSVPHMRRWNEFKDYSYHQQLWSKFWSRKYKGSTNDSIMDFGCGSCWCWLVAKSLDFTKVINLDIDIEEVRTSFENYTDIFGAKVEYWNGTTMPFEANTFDSIIAKASIRKLVSTELKCQINELARVTKAGGKWYISPIDMYDWLTEELDKTGLTEQLDKKEITLVSWTWKPAERQKIVIKNMLRPIKHLLTGKGDAN
ncbi:class I SAM-dependent methyltransferase [Candidatus Pacearchaeota archaeon]|nr:class I SAM-dependent methyltransferase [Candidatus Pacearchaeota archaeon]